MSSVPPPPQSQPQGIPYQTPPIDAEMYVTSRFNWRIAVFAGLMLFLIGWPAYTYLEEVITGGVHDRGAFKEVDLKAMSSFDMDQHYAKLDDIPPQFRALEGKNVLMTGEMWAPADAGDGTLSYFQLVYSKTKCCFSGPPLAQHFVDGNVTKGVAAYYYDVPVKVWGKLHVFVRKDETGTIKSIYHVEVKKVEPIEN